MLTKNWKSLAALCALTLFLTAGSAQAALVTLGHNTDGTGNAGLTNVNAGGATAGAWGSNDGNHPADATHSPHNPDGKNWNWGTGDVTPTFIATGSSALGSDTIQAGDYTINFYFSNIVSGATTSTLTADANYVADASIVSLGNLGGIVDNTIAANWNPAEEFFSYNFTVGAASPAIGNYLQLTFQATTTGGVWKGLDTISADFQEAAAVPEPRSLTLLSTGLLGLLAAGWRRRHRA